MSDTLTPVPAPNGFERRVDPEGIIREGLDDLEQKSTQEKVFSDDTERTLAEARAVAAQEAVPVASTLVEQTIPQPSGQEDIAAVHPMDAIVAGAEQANGPEDGTIPQPQSPGNSQQ